MPLATLEPSAARIREQALALNVNTGQRLSNAMRANLIVLAQDCGLPFELADTALDNDLIGICLVAKKDAQAAQRTAARIADRLQKFNAEPDPILGPTPRPEPAPAPRVDPVPEPKGTPSSATPEPSKADLAAFLKSAKDYADDMDFNTAATLRDKIESDVQRVREETAQRAESLRSEITEALPTLAHNAVADALKKLAPQVLNISLNAAPPVPLGLVHRDTGRLIQALAAGLNVYLHGPAGSGKTTAGNKAAEAFKLQFYFAAKVESEYQLLGFTDAKGCAVRTQFREAYEHGGVFLFDEMDASSPAAVVALNAALANGICPFPDAIVKRHKDFHVIGAGNTKLTGANRQYAGRNKLDAASIDRFAFIEWNYDDTLERALATDGEWCDYVQRVRQACLDRGIDHLVTPRATYDGCKLLAAGFKWEQASDMCIFKGLDVDTVAQIKGQI